jgi:hypothetical protein
VAFKEIYHIRDDEERLGVWQFELEQEQLFSGLRDTFGSDAWWQALDRGRIPSAVVEATVAELESREVLVRVVEANGRQSRWPILGYDDEVWRLAYQPGRPIRYTVVDMGDELPCTIVRVDVDVDYSNEADELIRYLQTTNAVASDQPQSSVAAPGGLRRS